MVWKEIVMTSAAQNNNVVTDAVTDGQPNDKSSDAEPVDVRTDGHNRLRRHLILCRSGMKSTTSDK